MKIEVIAIQNDRELKAARSLVASLMGATSRRDVARLRAQAAVLAAWEAENHPATPPDPVEAIRFRMEQMGLEPKDLVDVLGTRSRVTEVLRGRRRLSPSMIRRLHDRLGIPAEVLIRDPRAAA